MRSAIPFIMIMAFIIGSTNYSFSQNSEQIYQKGLMKEEGEGELSKAIAIYNQILENKDASKSLQAKALLHIGMCYEKMGMQEATKAYQNLVNNYPGQKNEVAIARERLSKLIVLAEKIPKAPLEPKFTKIKIPTKLYWSVNLSPDGVELAFALEKKLWKMPLSGNLGPDIPGIPVQVNTDDVEVADWAPLSFSQNGKWLAFNGNSSLDDKGDDKYPSIYVVSSDGGKAKKVIENDRGGRIANYRISLSHDAKKLAFSSIEEKKQHIFSTSVENVIPKQLVEMEAREPVFSPDGKYIAFVKDKNRGIGEGDLGLWVIPSEGGKPQLLAEARKASNPLWSPDGKLIAFLGFSVGNQISIVPFSKTANTIGEVIHIDAPEGTENVWSLAGWTPDNKIGALLLSKFEYGLYTLPAKGGQAAIVLDEGNPLQPRWSPDSKNIYYTNSPIEHSSWTGSTLAVVSAKGGNGTALPKRKDVLLNIPFSYQSGNRVSPDGKTIISSASNKEMVWNKYPSTQIWKIPVDGGNPTQITNPNPLYGDMAPSWSPDGNQLAFLRFPLNYFNGKEKEEDSCAIYMLNIDDTIPKLLLKEKFVLSPVWSPDGKMIAYLSSQDDDVSSINVVNVINGESHMIAEISRCDAHMDLAWSPDSKRIAFNDNERKVVKIVSLSDGDIEDVKTNLVDVKIRHLDWSPDGERFVFAGMKGGDKEFWFLEDFLPLDKLAQKEPPKPVIEPEGIRIEQVWSGPEVDNSGSVSADGEYLSFVDWDSGDLALRNLNTKQNRSLVSGSWDAPMQYAQYNVISPNGKQIAYSWWNKNASDLYLINIDNPSPRLLYRKRGVEVYPVSWLSDKEIIVKTKKKGNDGQIGYFNILDGTMNLLKPFKQRKWPQLSSAPDEKHIAYDFANESHNGTFDINLLSMDGNSEISLVNHPANDRVLGWTPGRKEFLFISDRSGTWDLWALDFEDGKPFGLAKQIYANIGEVSSMGFTENGDCYFSFSRRNFTTYIAPFNIKTGELQEQEGKSLIGSNFQAKWSPDGQYLAYIKEDSKAENPWQLTIQDLKTGNERKVGNSLYLSEDPCWSPDGNSLIVIGMDKSKLSNKNHKGGVYQVDAKTGKTVELLLLSDYQYNMPDDDAFPLSDIELSEDGKSFYYLFFKDRLVKYDLETEEENILYKQSHFDRGVLKRSPNGERLLFAAKSKEQKKTHLFTMSVEGGNEKELCTPQEANNFEMAAWSPDGRYIYFGELYEGTNLWRIPAEGGIPEKVWQSEKRLDFISIAKDGNQIVFSVRERITEIRVIKGLVQELNRLKVKG